MIYVITGHLGSGKSLLAVDLALGYLRAGKRVASNITLNLDKAMNPRSTRCATKLPYIPQAHHLDALGKGYEGDYDEDKFGLCLLDEAGSWLNSRDWADKDRRGLFTWITHARKHGWDVALLVQDFEALDTQIRKSVTEVHVTCSRLDRIKMPYLPFHLPKVHRATARYGGPTGPVYKRWHSWGKDVWPCYDTREAVKPELMFTEDGPVDMRAMHTMLSAWHLAGRYKAPKRSPMIFVYALLVWLVRCVIGLPLSMAAGRSPVAMLQLPTIPPVEPLKPLGPMPRRQLPDFAGA